MLESIFLIGALGVIFWQRHSFQKILTVKNKELQNLTAHLSHAQEQSFHDQGKHDAILSSMVEGVMVIGSDEKILYVSPNASGLFQMRSLDVTHRPYWEVIPHAQINASMQEALEHKAAVNKEITLLGLTDTYFSMQISPVVQEGTLSSVVAVFHNITELKQLLKMRSEFVANVSHELKTPLTSIKGFVETLCEEGTLEDKEHAQKFLNIIHKQTLRLEELVNDLLILSSIESKEAKMDFHMQAIGPIIQSVCTMCSKSIQEKAQDVLVEIALNTSQVFIDRNRMEQVFINLIDNAVKFTPKGGKIIIRASQEGNFCRIDVKDNGQGISPEHLPRIFERFYRVDKSRNEQTGGTGLGLAIVKRIVQAHQGKVEVQSKVNSGSTFSIFLPIALVEAK